MDGRVVAEYLIETAFDPEHAAQALAGEQSSGTFVAVPGETAELKARAAARVESISELEPAPRPTLGLTMVPMSGRPCTLARRRVPSMPN